jgi:hypothetical protein
MLRGERVQAHLREGGKYDMQDIARMLRDVAQAERMLEQARPVQQDIRWWLQERKRVTQPATPLPPPR